MFDVRSLLDELLREDPRRERQTHSLGEKDQAPIPAVTAPVEPQGALAPAVHLASAELRLSELASSGEQRPAGAAGPALAQTPHPAGDRPAAKVPSLEEELRRLRARADFTPEGAQGPTAGGGLGDLFGKLEVEARHGGGGLLAALGQVLSQAAGWRARG